MIEDPATSPAKAAVAKPMAAPSRPRLWPALLLVAAYWISFAIANLVFPASFQQFMIIFWAPQVLAPCILIWWLFFSRLPWQERLWDVGCLVLAGAAAVALAHKSMLMGMAMYAAPVAITAVVLTLFATQRAAASLRGLAVLIASVLGWGYFTLIRVDGVTGNLQAERSWRWNQTAEDKFLAERQKKSREESSSKADAAAASSELVATASDWPEFRGVHRDGHLVGFDLSADWTAQPPRELWRQLVGPGWSSFAVVGNHVYTQEQRGEAEAVVCLSLATGEELWSHEDQSRFYETVGGAGPRATPTFHGGKIYSCGGSGVLNCLDAATGKLVWSHDIAADAKTTPPVWGFSSSPLVAGGAAIVFAGGKEGKSVLAYDAQTGELRWAAGKGTHSYSSPQLFTAAGQQQVLMVSEHGIEAFDPADGRVVWEHDWNIKDIFRVCQPHVIGDSQILVGTPMTEGTRLLTVTKDGDAWNVKEEWTSKDLKPYFNDFVRLEGYLYGFDSDILVCIDLATGKKKWKKGRYGHGQALLIGDKGRLLVISDKGEAILTEVSPNGLTELGRFQAISGKTWNHPVIAGGKLLVRNGEEMACFELATANRSL